ncbi:MAG: LamG domain-containing protein [Sedimentisphaerales bacterium]|nr:LamG domain-containing protein [Sedimentisphaerales bacterium]
MFLKRHIFYWGSTGQPGSLWNIRINYLGNLRFQTNGGAIYSNTVVTTGEWIHVAVVLPEGGDNTEDILLYINGQPEPPEALTITASTINTIAGEDMRIGADISGHYFTGLIDDVRIYDRALSSAEIAALYAQQAGL